MHPSRALSVPSTIAASSSICANSRYLSWLYKVFDTVDVDSDFIKTPPGTAPLQALTPLLVAVGDLWHRGCAALFGSVLFFQLLLLVPWLGEFRSDSGYFGKY